MNHTTKAAPAVAVWQHWRALALLSGLVLVAFVFAMYGTFQTLVDLWLNNTGYGHGFIVIGVCLYLISLRRSEIARVNLQSSVTSCSSPVN